ncbi:MAG: hypothetical protein ACLUFI_14725 [Oscillospiraceae bacterium]
MCAVLRKTSWATAWLQRLRARARFTEPAFAKSFLEALGDETHADILAQLTVQTQRVQKRRQEAQAHRKNVKMGKK